jgi:hypothetical protein
MGSILGMLGTNVAVAGVELVGYAEENLLREADVEYDDSVRE